MGVAQVAKKNKAMRNPNGFGSVYKLSGRRRRPWVAVITTGWENIEGEDKQKRLTQTIGYFEDKGSALEALVANRTNPVSPKASIKLGELYEEWSKGKYEYISKSTVGSYRAGWKHLSEYKDTEFKELRTSHFQSVLDKCHRSGMSRSTLEKIKIVSKMLYDYAIQNDIVNRNYAEFLNLPKAENEEKQTFTDLEIQKLEKSEGLPWVELFLF